MPEHPCSGYKFSFNLELYHPLGQTTGIISGVFDNLLQTKLTIPPVSDSLVARPSLAARLAISVGHKLTLITAPAGYGKTTLLATWLTGLRATIDGGEVAVNRHKHSEEANRQCRTATLSAPPVVNRKYAWLSLDPADDNPGRFCVYLLAALQTISPDIGRSAEPLLQGRRDPPPVAVMTALLNDLVAYGGSVTLVIDDYHIITDTAVHDAMSLLIDQLPATAHLIIASRTIPPWPLARWRARSQLAELTMADLQFSTDDTTVFLNDLMSLNLTANDIVAIAERAEGWVAGLKLISLAMRSNNVRSQWIAHLSGQHRFIFDYLAEEVFNQQPPDIQQFLLDMAVLERLAPDLCDALRGEELAPVSMLPRPPASSILLQLEHTNLFLPPLDEERHWYRFHSRTQALARAQELTLL